MCSFLKEIGKAICFIILIPILTIATIIGFRTCWQCHETKHLFQLEKYKNCLFDKKPLVCKECHVMLNHNHIRSKSHV